MAIPPFGMPPYPYYPYMPYPMPICACGAAVCSACRSHASAEVGEEPDEEVAETVEEVAETVEEVAEEVEEVASPPKKRLTYPHLEDENGLPLRQGSEVNAETAPPVKKRKALLATICSDLAKNQEETPSSSSSAEKAVDSKESLLQAISSLSKEELAELVKNFLASQKNEEETSSPEHEPPAKTSKTEERHSLPRRSDTDARLER